VVEAVAYYKRAVDLDTEDAQTWGDYARAALDAGRTDEAKGAYELAASKASGDDAHIIRASALIGQGEIALVQGRLSEALRFFQSAQEIMDRAAKTDPNNAGCKRCLSVSYAKVGDIQSARGDLAGALQSFEHTIEMQSQLAKTDPDNAGSQRDLAVSYERVGEVLKAQGNMPGALKSFQDSFAIFERLAKAEPGDTGGQRDLSVSYRKVGGMLEKRGRVRALKPSRTAAIADRLAKTDPTTPDGSAISPSPIKG
jgi:tetratricopeptide (TPR) repeat protein